jgi:hypothetical protein
MAAASQLTRAAAAARPRATAGPQIQRFLQRQQRLQQQQQRAAFHYDPHQYTYGAKPPFRSRLKDMFIGAAGVVALVGGFFAYELWDIGRQRSSLQHELQAELDELRDWNRDIAARFASARAMGDHLALRRLTFELARRAHADSAENSVLDRVLGRVAAKEAGESSGVPDSNSSATTTPVLPPHVSEVGTLPGLPYDDARSGRELVPADDTLMFLLTDPDDDDRIVACHVAVNLEADEVYRGMADPVPPPDADKLGELLRRIDNQVRAWRRQRRLVEDDQGVDLMVNLTLRDQTWSFEYADGHFDSISGLTTIGRGPSSFMEMAVGGP